jgi:ketol-acid reductoisomerase
MHELKLIVDLMYRGGLNFMRFSVSDTAEFGDYVSGPRVAEGVKATMKDVLADIQSGAFAERWIAVQEAGGGEFQQLRQRDRDHQIEQVGAELRAQMPFLNPVVVQAGEAQAAASSNPAPAASGGTR